MDGRTSSLCQTKHINARYFLIKDKQDHGEIEIKYEPTDVMWSDVLKKPKQGQPYRVMHGQLINCLVDYDDDVEHRATHPCLLTAVTRGKVHDYLGMDLDFSQKGILKVSMIPYTGKVIQEFPEKIIGTAASPAADHLFQIRDKSDAKYLPEELAMAFHRTTAQLLFMSARARWDIQTAVAFLCTRVKKPDEDDWGKLKQVLKYLNGTKHMKPVLTVDTMSIIRW